MCKASLLALFCIGCAFAADPVAPTVGKVLDRQLSMVESELVPLAEAMPADKFDFAPTAGEFKGVRTFGQQVSHVAAVIYIVSAATLGEAVPAAAGEGENGPPTLKTKADIVAYLKASMVYGHKAMMSVTDTNSRDLIKSPFSNQKSLRLDIATASVWHSFDHYGQLAVYLRMNGIVPPASR